jgi:hypothetical protein
MSREAGEAKDLSCAVVIILFAYETNILRFGFSTTRLRQFRFCTRNLPCEAVQ